jgi:hypothetical protein
MSFIYLASPYTGETLEEMQERYEKVMEHTAWMLDRSVTVYSPIMHCHNMAMKHALPRSVDFWLYHDKNMIMASHELRILTLDRWRQSVGIKAEIKFARSIGLPITKVGFKTSLVEKL